MSERKQGSKYVEIYREPGFLAFLDASGLITKVPCLDGAPERLNMDYAQELAAVMERYGKRIGVYR